MTDSNILRYCLGDNDLTAPDLAQNTIVVIMDCEKFVFPPRCVTEYGLHTFTRKDMVPTFSQPSAYGEHILQNIYYYHLRLLENCHYVSRAHCIGDPEKNHFGLTRFATKQEAKNFLTGAISWPIDEQNPESGICPAIFMGHSVGNELDMLQQELGIDPSVMSNVVAVIDTQTIAVEQEIHGRGNRIGLEALCKCYGVPYDDPHTASNDAAYTAITGIQMVMGSRLPNIPSRSMEAVVKSIQTFSRTVDPAVGIANYCTRCGRYAHNRPNCYGRIQRCQNCLASGNPRAAYTHVTELCTYPPHAEKMEDSV
jgi:hypothetical protein